MSESRNSIFQLINRLSQLSGYIAALSILAATLIIVEQVVVRYVFKIPTIWQVETAVNLLIAATFLGAPYGLKENAHIHIDMLIINLPAGVRRKLDLATAAVAMGFCFFLAYRGGIMWWEAYEGGWRSSSLLSVPLSIPTTFLRITGLVILWPFPPTVYSSNFTSSLPPEAGIFFSISTFNQFHAAPIPLAGSVCELRLWRVWNPARVLMCCSSLLAEISATIPAITGSRLTMVCDSVAETTNKQRNKNIVFFMEW